MTDDARERALEENRRRSQVLANSRPRVGGGPASAPSPQEPPCTTCHVPFERHDHDDHDFTYRCTFPETNHDALMDNFAAAVREMHALRSVLEEFITDDEELEARVQAAINAAD